MKAEWRGRTEFAEVAEAVGVDTDRIVAVLPHREAAVVLFTYDDEDVALWPR
jgi:hypothetical protein